MSILAAFLHPLGMQCWRRTLPGDVAQRSSSDVTLWATALSLVNDLRGACLPATPFCSMFTVLRSALHNASRVDAYSYRAGRGRCPCCRHISDTVLEYRQVDRCGLKNGTRWWANCNACDRRQFWAFLRFCCGGLVRRGTVSCCLWVWARGHLPVTRRVHFEKRPSC